MNWPVIMDLGEQSTERLARVFHALGHSTRLAIAFRLRQGELCVTQLTTTLGGSQSNMSAHLSLLHGAGVLGRRREENRIYYALANDRVRMIIQWLASQHRLSP
ncbi:MAG: metalloregulator ArsR/SmtB family transcription factor [Azoarcus sp.]|nr:metalloregulator ArsR/SmtB family transcription factor [Azoarcus sp.]